MNKKYIISKNKEIQSIIKSSSKKISKYFIIYFVGNKLNHNRYCISISKKIGKANVRNLLKRRVKDILMKNNINYSMDYVIILRSEVLYLKYDVLQKELMSILKGE